MGVDVEVGSGLEVCVCVVVLGVGVGVWFGFFATMSWMHAVPLRSVASKTVNVTLKVPGTK